MSEEKDNIHPVVRLLAARMESHPEEFGFKGNGRWSLWLESLHHIATPEEKLLLRTARMNEIHEEVLDELMNGPDRRAEEARKHQEDLKHYRQQKSAVAQQLGQYQNALSSSAYAAQMQNALPGTIIPIPPMENQGLVATVKRTFGLK